MNDMLSAMARRFSCRAFSDMAPDDEQLRAVAQAAIQSPSGMNRQHWQIIVVKNRELIADMDREGMRVLSGMEDNSLHERMMARGGTLFYHAPCMVLIAVKQAVPPGAELIDCGIVAQSVVLAAASLGLDSLHCGLAGMAFAGGRAAEFKERLRFPAEYECGMAVLLGHASQAGQPHTPDQAKITWID